MFITSQGATIRPLVKLLDITLHPTSSISLFGEIDEHVSQDCLDVPRVKLST